MSRNSRSIFRSWIERMLRFRTGLATPDYAEGTLFYDSVNKCLALMADVPGNVLQIGQESYIRAINKTGSTIANGRAVYVSGFDSASGRPTIAEAQANAEATSLCSGVTTTAFPNDSEGFVTVFGIVRDQDTSGLTSGAPLYLSATLAGRFTGTRPTRPNIAVAIGTVGAVSASVGSINVAANRVRHQDVLGSNIDAASVTTPTRAFNTNFQPHATRPTLCLYSVRIDGTGTLTLTGGSTTVGHVSLRSDTAATPTTERCRMEGGGGLTGTLIVGVAINSTSRDAGVLCFLVPPAWNVRLVTVNETGTPTFTMIKSTEIIL